MWKPIPNWENLYEVNETGAVRNTNTHRLLVGDKNNAGYYRVTLYNHDRRERFFRHRLVATLFIPNPLNYKEVNHIDGDKSNNNISNLEWCNRTHNEREAHRSGIKLYRPFIVKYTDGKTVVYEFASELSQILKVTKRTILNYLSGKSNNYKNRNIVEIRYL